MADFKKYVLQGKLLFPRLAEATLYNAATNKFDIEPVDGKFQTLMTMTKENSKAFMEQLEILKVEAIQEIRDSKKYATSLNIEEIYPQIVEHEDKDGKLTGLMQLKFGRKATNSKGDAVKVNVVDKRNRPIDLTTLKTLAGGSTANVQFSINPYSKKVRDNKTKVETIEYGLSFILLGVQVIDFVERGSESGFEDLGAEDEEDSGFKDVSGSRPESTPVAVAPTEENADWEEIDLNSVLDSMSDEEFLKD